MVGHHRRRLSGGGGNDGRCAGRRCRGRRHQKRLNYHFFVLHGHYF